jgi:hypothetical protein
MALIGRVARPFLSPGLLNALLLFVTLRVVFGLVALYVWGAGTLPGPCNFELARDGWTTIPPLADQGAAFPLVGVWQRWDACWYTKIATFGYEPGINSANFWPLFPLLTAVTGRLLFGAMALGGLIVAGVAYIVAMTGIERLVSRDFDLGTARRTVIAISVWPAAFFFFAPFTESLFLATSVWALLAARERCWWLAAIAALLASLTRIQGLFLILPLGWEALMTFRERAAVGALPGSRFSPRDLMRTLRSGFRPIATAAVAALAPAVGFVGFLIFSAAATGQTPLDTQDAWGGKNFHPPWDVAGAAWQWAVDHHDPLQALNLIALIGFLVLLIAGIRRLPVAYTLLAAPQVLLIATRIQPTPLTSTVRLLMVVFPAFVLLAGVKQPRLQLAWLIGSTMLLALLMTSFLHGDFVA